MVKFLLLKDDDEEAMETELFTNIGQNQVVIDGQVEYDDDNDANNYLAEDVDDDHYYDEYIDYIDFDDYDDYKYYNAFNDYDD